MRRPVLKANLPAAGAIALAMIPLITLHSAELAARDRWRPREATSINAIVIHSVGGPACIAGAVTFRPIPFRDDDAMFWRKVMLAAPSADAHYVIGRSGRVAEIMPITQIANHTVGVNDISVGIELVNRGDGAEPYGEAQIASLVALIRDIRGRVPAIPFENIVLHSEIDQRTCVCSGVTYHRRPDPGANFPFDQVLAAARLAGDGTRRPASLPRLTGPAPERACVTEQR